jgi:hypothetical protein
MIGRMRRVSGYLAGAVLVLALGPGVAFSPATASTEDLGKTVTYLLDLVANSDLTFIRNGITYTGREAVAHMKDKYDYFKRAIKTPEDFIRQAASKSILSGRPYLVKTKDGKEIETADWLGKALSEYRATQKNSKRVKG